MNQKKTLVIGASENPARYSNLAIQRLNAHQHPVVAIGLRKGMVGKTAIETEKKPMEDVDTVTLYLNPTRQKEYYDYMLSYSPYDNVEAKAYPNLLVTTGLQDSQVQYWEPAKWVAKLRTLKTDKNRLLLYTNMGAGHGGATGRFKRHRETAREYAFLLDLAEKKKVGLE